MAGAAGDEVAPRRLTGNSNDRFSTQGNTSLPIGPNEVEKPLGNDRGQRAHYHNQKARGLENLHGNEAEHVVRSMVVAEINSRDDKPCRAQNKYGDSHGDTKSTTQCFHQKGNVEFEGCHDMAESNIVKVNEARDPEVDGGGLTNLVGLTNSTSADTPQQSWSSPLNNKKENTGAWLVYSRNRGCKKQLAQGGANDKRLGITTKTNFKQPTVA